MPEYSQSAYRFGDYVAKFGVFPLGEEQKACFVPLSIPLDHLSSLVNQLICCLRHMLIYLQKLEKSYIADSDPINILSQGVRDFHMKHKVTYSFCAQLLQNLNEQPVDDLGVVWDEKKYPFEQIATIEVRYTPYPSPHPLQVKSLSFHSH